MSQGARGRDWGPWAVALAAICAHAASLAGGFLHWDDDRYLVQNPFVHAPSWEGLARLFVEPFYANYHPLHVASYALDHALFGHLAWGYHLINVLTFASAAGLATAFLRRAFPDERWPLFGALLFAVHPVHVESVAWLSARKDVLALLFAMAYAVCHLRAAAAPSPRSRRAWCAAGFVGFALALLSKVIVAPLPVALLVYDRLVARRPWRATLGAALAPLALAGVLLGVAYAAQAGEQAVKAYPGGSFLTGIWTMAPVLVRYLGLLLAPFELSAVYDVQTRLSALDPVVLSSLVLLVSLLGGAVWAWRRGVPMPLLALAWFAIPLAPVSGIVPLSHLMADRYLLLPSLGFAIFAAWALSRLSQRGALWRHVAVPLGALLAGLLLTGSVLRSLDWKDDLSLWSDAVTKAPRDPVAHVNLGSALADAGRFREAAAAFARALELRPQTPAAWRNLKRLAGAMERRGDWEGAARVRALLAGVREP
jgi:tetratricopeptide (TPR) repeat protein